MTDVTYCSNDDCFEIQPCSKHQIATGSRKREAESGIHGGRKRNVSSTTEAKQGVTSLASYLGSLREKLAVALASTEPVHIVMGNEAGDLDSMVSAVMRAFTLTHSTGILHFPLLNIFREDIGLRREAAWVFKEAGVEASATPCREDVDLESLHKAKRLMLTLVDHNVLAPEQACLADSVVGLVDHHKAEGKYSIPDTSRVILMVGSCATLVARDMLDSPLLTKETATLLLACVLLDTRNFSGEINFLPLDREVCERLVGISGREPAPFYSALASRRVDVSGLTFDELLRKDTKFMLAGALSYFVSTLPGLSLTRIDSDYPDWKEVLRALCTRKKMPLAGVGMSYTEKDGMKRELILSGFLGVRQLGDHLLKNTNLQLTELDSTEENGFSVIRYQQHNIQASRKQLLPFIQDFLVQSPFSSSSTASGTQQASSNLASSSSSSSCVASSSS